MAEKKKSSLTLHAEKYQFALVLIWHHNKHIQINNNLEKNAKYKSQLQKSLINVAIIK